MDNMLRRVMTGPLSASIRMDNTGSFALSDKIDEEDSDDDDLDRFMDTGLREQLFVTLSRAIRHNTNANADNKITEPAIPDSIKIKRPHKKKKISLKSKKHINTNTNINTSTTHAQSHIIPINYHNTKNINKNIKYKVIQNNAKYFNNNYATAIPGTKQTTIIAKRVPFKPLPKMNKMNKKTHKTHKRQTSKVRPYTARINTNNMTLIKDKDYNSDAMSDGDDNNLDNAPYKSPQLRISSSDNEFSSTLETVRKENSNKRIQKIPKSSLTPKGKSNIIDINKRFNNALNGNGNGALSLSTASSYAERYKERQEKRKFQKQQQQTKYGQNINNNDYMNGTRSRSARYSQHQHYPAQSVPLPPNTNINTNTNKNQYILNVNMNSNNNNKHNKYSHLDNHNDYMNGTRSRSARYSQHKYMNKNRNSNYKQQYNQLYNTHNQRPPPPPMHEPTPPPPKSKSVSNTNVDMGHLPRVRRTALLFEKKGVKKPHKPKVYKTHSYDHIVKVPPKPPTKPKAIHKSHYKPISSSRIINDNNDDANMNTKDDIDLNTNTNTNTLSSLICDADDNNHMSMIHNITSLTPFKIKIDPVTGEKKISSRGIPPPPNQDDIFAKIHKKKLNKLKEQQIKLKKQKEKIRISTLRDHASSVALTKLSLNNSPHIVPQNVKSMSFKDGSVTPPIAVKNPIKHTPNKFQAMTPVLYSSTSGNQWKINKNISKKTLQRLSLQNTSQSLKSSKQSSYGVPPPPGMRDIWKENRNKTKQNQNINNNKNNSRQSRHQYTNSAPFMQPNYHPFKHQYSVSNDNNTELTYDSHSQHSYNNSNHSYNSNNSGNLMQQKQSNIYNNQAYITQNKQNNYHNYNQNQGNNYTINNNTNLNQNNGNYNQNSNYNQNNSNIYNNINSNPNNRKYLSSPPILLDPMQSDDDNKLSSPISPLSPLSELHDGKEDDDNDNHPLPPSNLTPTRNRRDIVFEDPNITKQDKPKQIKIQINNEIDAASDNDDDDDDDVGVSDIPTQQDLVDWMSASAWIAPKNLKKSKTKNKNKNLQNKKKKPIVLRPRGATYNPPATSGPTPSPSAGLSYGLGQSTTSPAFASRLPRSDSLAGFGHNKFQDVTIDAENIVFPKKDHSADDYKMIDPKQLFNQFKKGIMDFENIHQKHARDFATEIFDGHLKSYHGAFMPITPQALGLVDFTNIRSRRRAVFGQKELSKPYRNGASVMDIPSDKRDKAILIYVETQELANKKRFTKSFDGLSRKRKNKNKNKNKPKLSAQLSNKSKSKSSKYRKISDPDFSLSISVDIPSHRSTSSVQTPSQLFSYTEHYANLYDDIHSKNNNKLNNGSNKNKKNKKFLHKIFKFSIGSNKNSKNKKIKNSVLPDNDEDNLSHSSYYKQSLTLDDIQHRRRSINQMRSIANMKDDMFVKDDLYGHYLNSSNNRYSIHAFDYERAMYKTQYQIHEIKESINANNLKRGDIIFIMDYEMIDIDKEDLNSFLTKYKMENFLKRMEEEERKKQSQIDGNNNDNNHKYTSSVESITSNASNGSNTSNSPNQPVYGRQRGLQVRDQFAAKDLTSLQELDDALTDFSADEWNDRGAAHVMIVLQNIGNSVEVAHVTNYGATRSFIRQFDAEKIANLLYLRAKRGMNDLQDIATQSSIEEKYNLDPDPDPRRSSGSNVIAAMGRGPPVAYRCVVYRLESQVIESRKFSSEAANVAENLIKVGRVLGDPAIFAGSAERYMENPEKYFYRFLLSSNSSLFRRTVRLQFDNGTSFFNFSSSEFVSLCYQRAIVNKKSFDRQLIRLLDFCPHLTPPPLLQKYIHLNIDEHHDWKCLGNIFFSYL